MRKNEENVPFSRLEEKEDGKEDNTLDPKQYSEYGTLNSDDLADYDPITSSDTYLEYRHKDFLNDVRFGWKLHISLDEKGSNVTKAWFGVIIPLFKKYKMASFKIKKVPKLGKHRDGKTVTVQLVYHTELQQKPCCKDVLIHTMIKELEAGLQDKKIVGGVVPSGDAKIQGSGFIYYRNEAGVRRGSINGVSAYTYLSSDQAKVIARNQGTAEYNPYSYTDEFRLGDLNLRPSSGCCILL